jgi:hypothetical protein
LENITIGTTESFQATNSITAGPNFTIASSGAVTFEAGNFITLKPPFYIIEGGALYASTNVETAIEHEYVSEIPEDMLLMPNYPNPFNPTTTIVFDLTQTEDVQLTILNNLGETIEMLVAKRLGAGTHQFTFDGADHASGIYYYQIIAGNYQKVRKMILLK